MASTSLVFPAERPRRHLGQHIVFLILLANALLSAVAAGAQLYLGYQRDREKVVSSIGIIDRSFRVGFENALWEFNFELVDALMDGVYNRADVQFLELKINSGESWRRGEELRAGSIVETLNFVHEDNVGKSISVGTMTIGLSLANVQARIWAQFWTLMLSNFAKTALASIVMLAIFNRLVSRHLKTIAAHVAGSSWLGKSNALELERSTTSSQDDLDYIVLAINNAKIQSVKSYEALTAEVDQRRAAEQTLAEKAVKLADMNELLLQTNREQAEFTYAISHDLKSPTNTVGMLLDELVLSHAHELSPGGLEMIESAQQTVERMRRLVEDVLGYSRTIEEEFTPEPVDLNRMLSEIVCDLREAISTADATVDIAELPVVKGSAVQLRMLFQNLLSNAIKFRAQDRLPKISVRSETDQNDGMAHISITDNGIGIAPEFHDRIFGLFQRLHSHNDFPGSGLGLTLCKRIVANHNGQIQLRSVPGEGTTFEFSVRKQVS